MMAATIRHESASTTKLREQPLTPKVAQDPLSGVTRLPLQTRPPEVTLERVEPRQSLQRFSDLTSSSSTS